ncbi:MULTISPECIES: penicillin-binding protein activator [Pseudomonas syringae group]|uniref:Penicillin-binding protein activator n=1 Tax=Pseudomonas lijiangensis TaxID=2995658 RepID=A0ABX8HS76_9PSED|nr:MULTISPECIES: penicillin-binding protein activator [Pseudomonas syringae group]MBI6852112.1 penicillin-binding protein activator [Pseudomonas cichorii]MBX8500371.1 penicillin-binding protein activator [Pseudomonas lijiangensis]MBX8505623.1 penicillin-binding protein activator [Pseudomonas lijiangensis]QWU82303.1 penicillin-binding protein activator [Pseudomonas lijiangensis]GFM68797.1 penicillin-binding protein activator [Pseudomonas cichorii]
MIACLRLFSALCLAALLAACASSPSSSLGELPRTPDASIEQLLEQAAAAKTPDQAAPLRLSAADLANRQNNPGRAAQILAQVPLDQLKPGLQVFASTLAAELAMGRNQPKAALTALEHPSLQRLGELSVEQQIRTHAVRARALEADGQTLAAARERVFAGPLLQGNDASANNDAIWALVASLPADQLQSTSNDDMGGWLSLARSVKGAGTLEQQQAAIDSWKAQNPQHPAAQKLPTTLAQLRALTSEPLTKIALLLPQDGQLASVAKALREGFMAAHYQAQQAGQNPPAIQVFDSSRVTSMDDFYRQAKAAGAQLVVGPLEKNLVKQLNSRQQLPITTLALNYSDSNTEGPAQLFQFGLAAEDEAREVARRAWADGKRSAVAMVPKGEWGDRVLDAFRKSWQAKGGTLIAAEHVDQPVALAQQVADLFQLRNSEGRAQRLQSTVGTQVAAQPTRRQDIDFMFLAATPQQAQQIKPTMVFQYAGDVPVYATSHLFTNSNDQAQYLDLNGVRFCETPWLLNANDPLRQQVTAQWPQASGSLGRLYAMGIDAYRLAPRLGQLKTLPESRIDGLSGSLSLSPSRRVERQLPWAEFVDGKVQRLPDTAP